MFVYVLFVTVISFVPGEIDIQVRQKAIESYPTADECETELKRITKDMEVAYPGHTDYRLTCEKRDKQPPRERIF